MRSVSQHDASFSSPGTSQHSSIPTNLKDLNYGDLKKTLPNSVRIFRPKSLDYDSRIGRFGWSTFNHSFRDSFPFIFRGDAKLCSVQIIEAKLKRMKFHENIKANIIRFAGFNKVGETTSSEARLFAEINDFHCNGRYGILNFEKDTLISCSDAYEYDKFLQTVTVMLNDNNPFPNCFAPNAKCGYMKIIGEDSVIAYVRKNNSLIVPTFYFEDLAHFKDKIVKVDGWDLSYLKFCCKAQGINEVRYLEDKLDCIDISDIKAHFPSGVKLEEHKIQVFDMKKWLCEPKKKPELPIRSDSGNSPKSCAPIEECYSANAVLPLKHNQEISSLESPVPVAVMPTNGILFPRFDNQLLPVASLYGNYPPPEFLPHRHQTLSTMDQPSHRMNLNMASRHQSHHRINSMYAETSMPHQRQPPPNNKKRKTNAPISCGTKPFKDNNLILKDMFNKQIPVLFHTPESDDGVVTISSLVSTFLPNASVDIVMSIMQDNFHTQVSLATYQQKCTFRKFGVINNVKDEIPIVSLNDAIRFLKYHI